MSKPTISYEFFPPKTSEMETQMFEAVDALRALGPKYMTVTYGAGGSTKDKTRQCLKRIRGECDIPLASHLTFLSTTKDELDAYIDSLWAADIKAIVALRGDVPKGRSIEDFNGDEYYTYTSDFVEAILKKHPFDVTVGAYPEKHPEAPSLAADIEALKLKCEAGATRAITQFFFDNNLYYEFLEQCEAARITTPIYPGLLPIYDYHGLQRFAAKCGANIPAEIDDALDGLGAGSDDALKAATDIMILQAQDLAANGIEHIHFYSMNRPEITKAACEALGYRSH